MRVAPEAVIVTGSSVNVLAGSVTRLVTRLVTEAVVVLAGKVIVLGACKRYHQQGTHSNGRA